MVRFEQTVTGLESVGLPFNRHRHKSGRLDSDQRPPAPKAGALPGFATPSERILAAGFEPATSRLEGARSGSAELRENGRGGNRTRGLRIAMRRSPNMSYTPNKKAGQTVPCLAGS